MTRSIIACAVAALLAAAGNFTAVRAAIVFDDFSSGDPDPLTLTPGNPTGSSGPHTGIGDFGAGRISSVELFSGFAGEFHSGNSSNPRMRIDGLSSAGGVVSAIAFGQPPNFNSILSLSLTITGDAGKVLEINDIRIVPEPRHATFFILAIGIPLAILAEARRKKGETPNFRVLSNRRLRETVREEFPLCATVGVSHQGRSRQSFRYIE